MNRALERYVTGAVSTAAIFFCGCACESAFRAGDQGGSFVCAVGAGLIGYLWLTPQRD